MAKTTKAGDKMKIGDMIRRLEEIKAEHGDIEIEWLKKFNNTSYTKFIHGISSETTVYI